MFRKIYLYLSIFDILIATTRGLEMRFSKYVDEKTKREYFQHSHLIYLSTFFAFFAIIPLFFLSRSILITAISFVTMGITAIAVLINRRGYYGLASFIFILIITIQAAAEVIVFGLEVGFQYYFFNMAVLIVFAKWNKIQKLIAASIEALIFIAVLLVALRFSPLVILSHPLALVFHIINIVLNILGVARTAYHFLSIARGAEKDLLTYAQTDFLTSLPNRAAYHRFVYEMKERFKSKPFPPVVIMMIDIDNFKTINDKYGHAAGDEVLIVLGKTFKERLQGGDFLARYGGEEFVLIHLAQNEEEARRFAESLRQEIKGRTFHFEEKDIRLSISVGALYRSPTNKKDCEEALEEADILLYQAKKEGRNRVAFKSI